MPANACCQSLVHTIVIGMFGALGKMNLTSSNLPRRRHVSASDTLEAAHELDDLLHNNF